MSQASLLEAIRDLWQMGFNEEELVERSAAFLKLCSICAEMYCTTDSPYRIESSQELEQQRTELRNLFRSTGAPWFRNATFPKAADVPALIEDAYRRRTQRITHFIPLDMADELPSIDYGPYSLRRFSADQLSEALGIERLSRYGEVCTPDLAALSEFQWLTYSEYTERALPFRSKEFLQKLDFDEIGRIRQRNRRFSEEVELGLFILTLVAWEDCTGGQFISWQPFRTPWSYVLSDDPFVFPPRAPDPRTLTWETVAAADGAPFEIAYCNTISKIERLNLAQTLNQLYERVSAVLSRARAGKSCFNLLIEHYMLRAFQEDGLDQLLWHSATVDAALGDRGASATRRLVRKVALITQDDSLGAKFEEIYDRRSEYIHGRRIDDSNLWQSDLAGARRIARLVVTGVLQAAFDHPEWNRNDLLAHLKR